MDAGSDGPLILTLGYGKRSIDAVIAQLEQWRVRYLVDIRTAPYSRYRPEFSRDALRGRIEAEDIRYLFLGKELGGRPDDPALYDDKNRVVYERCRERPEFVQGIERLHAAWEGGHRVALLCSESRPEDCHRSKLVGRALDEADIPVLHLDENDEAIGQPAVMERLEGGQPGLFPDLAPPAATHSRRRYGPGDR